jgi:hypothetical protein
MAIGFPASYTVKFEFAGTRGQAREAVRHALSILQWRSQEVTPDLFEAKIAPSVFSWGERFVATLAEGQIEIRSACSSPLQIFDWSKNRRNVEDFLLHFSVQERRDFANRGITDEALFANSEETPITRLFAPEPPDKIE